MGCREYRWNISREADGAIDRAERERLERHLESCPECLRFREAVRAAAAIHRGLTEISPSPGLVSSILTAVAERRRERAWYSGWLRVAVPAAVTAVAVCGFWLGGLLTERLTRSDVQSQTDVLELQYLNEYPPGSVGEILMASNEGGGNERN